MPERNSISACSMTMAKVSRRTTRKPISGLILLPLAVEPATSRFKQQSFGMRRPRIYLRPIYPRCRRVRASGLRSTLRSLNISTFHECGMKATAVALRDPVPDLVHREIRKCTLVKLSETRNPLVRCIPRTSGLGAQRIDRFFLAGQWQCNSPFRVLTDAGAQREIQPNQPHIAVAPRREHAHSGFLTH